MLDPRPRLSLRQTSAPAEEPLTLADVKLHLRIDNDLTDQNAVLDALIVAARTHCENATGRQLITAEWELYLDCFPRRGPILLPRPPLIADETIRQVLITYLDTNGDTQTVPTTDYVVGWWDLPGRVTLAYGADWPDTLQQEGAVTVAYVSGYGGLGEDVPQPIKQAMLLLIGHWYENREATISGTISQPIAFAVESLLSAYVCPEQW